MTRPKASQTNVPSKMLILTLSVICTCELCLVATSERSWAIESDSGRQFAVLIGVTDHDDDSLDLRYTNRDVQSLKSVLMERGGLRDGFQILEFSDQMSSDFRPSSANIKRDLEKFLKGAGRNDRVLLFFSGHGIQINGETYFVTSDFDRNNPGETSLPSSWIRGLLNNCRAKTKFIIIDACHAGGTRSVGPDVSSESIAKAIQVEQLTGCVVLASCRPDEKSFEWTERRNGLFTYWLCRALEGLADTGDARLTSDEVYRYTHKRVTDTAQRVFNRPQTPVRIIGPDVAGSLVLLSLQAESPEAVCTRLAKQLDLEIRQHRLKRVAVLEFVMQTGAIGRQRERLTQANLPAYCANEVRETLFNLARGDYEVLSEAEVRRAVKGIQVQFVGDPAAMQPVTTQGKAPDCLVYGSLKRRGTKLNVSCELIRTADQEPIVEPTGVMPLSTDLIGDLGQSFHRQDPPPTAQEDPQAIQYVLQQADREHPLLAGSFPFKVEVWSIDTLPDAEVTSRTGRTKKQFYTASSLRNSRGISIEPNELAITARKDEVYEIRVTSNYPEKVGMALFIDGINTNRKQRERLANARLWVLRPRKTIAYEGWYEPENEGVTSDRRAFNRSRFYFTDIADSVAGRQQFSDKIGVISVAFYKEAEEKPVEARPRGARSLGTGGGPNDRVVIKSSKFVRGDLLGVVHIRYIDEQDIRHLRKVPSP